MEIGLLLFFSGLRAALPEVALPSSEMRSGRA